MVTLGAPAAHVQRGGHAEQLGDVADGLVGGHRDDLALELARHDRQVEALLALVVVDHVDDEHVVVAIRWGFGHGEAV